MSKNTTTTNNTIATTNASIVAPAEFAFEAVLNEASVTDVLHTTMIETMFNQVVVNTVRTGAHVTEHYLSLMKEVFKDFLNCTEIKFVKTNINTDDVIMEETFDFLSCNDKWEDNAIRLIALLKRERMFFEITYTHDDNKKGFICYDGYLEKELFIVK
jgi:hypothetical protein